MKTCPGITPFKHALFIGPVLLGLMTSLNARQAGAAPAPAAAPNPSVSAAPLLAAATSIQLTAGMGAALATAAAAAATAPPAARPHSTTGASTPLSRLRPVTDRARLSSCRQQWVNRKETRARPRAPAPPRTPVTRWPTAARRFARRPCPPPPGAPPQRAARHHHQQQQQQRRRPQAMRAPSPPRCPAPERRPRRRRRRGWRSLRRPWPQPLPARM